MPKLIDLTGQKFGRLLVISIASRNKWGNIEWECLCDCGTKKNVAAGNLRRGNTSSCGCLHKEATASINKSHGMAKTRLYRIWAGMKGRCDGTDGARTKIYYHDRGIRVCDEWNSSFEVFRDWAVLNGYSDNLSIDRIDNDGNYEPSNCRWANAKIQANNRSNNIIVEFDGRLMTLAEAAIEQCVNYSTLYYREGRKA